MILWVIDMKGLEEAKELAKADLPEPALLRHFIYSKTDYTTRRTMKISRFVSTIEMWNGKLIQRVFGFVASTTQRRMWDMEVREVARYLEGFNHCLLRDVWHDMFKHCVEYDRKYQKDEFWICDGKPWNFYGYIMYDESKMIEQLNIPYCQYHSENNQSYLSFFQYICLYRKEPKIELLVKAGLCPSKGEARRLVQQGGVTAKDEKITDIGTTFPATDFDSEFILRKGKKVFIKITK